jgi:hypothetical protein
MSYQSVNPFDNKLVKSFKEITDKDLEQKIAAATTCFETWRRTNCAERAKVVNKAANLLDDPTDHFSHIMTLEIGQAPRRGEWRGRSLDGRARRHPLAWPLPRDPFLLPHSAGKLVGSPSVHGIYARRGFRDGARC